MSNPSNPRISDRHAALPELPSKLYQQIDGMLPEELDTLPRKF